MSRIVVVDYGAGNLHSVARAFRHEGADVVISADADAIASAERLVLPGVGAFADAASELTRRELVDPIRRFVATGRPFLGICVGMQLLLTESTEFGPHPGLGLVPGRVVRIPSEGVKVPHVGWNAIAPPPSQPDAWRGTPLEGSTPPMVYFVHSYNAEPEDENHRLADARYGETRITAAVRRDNVVGFQFHPELSGPAGLAILRRFLG